LPESWYTEGVKVITFLSERSIPGAKSIDYVAATIALKQARNQGAIEAIYVDRKGHALEGTTSNIFAIINGTLVTPGSGILNGITRQAVLDLAARTIAVDIRDLNLDELTSADEVFITGTNKMIVPVIKVDDSTIGSGFPGQTTRGLIQALGEEIDHHTENHES
jgi:branched-chain amino acid aminotransferase